MSDLTKTEKLAKELIKQHCPDFSFVWMNKKRVLGDCNIWRQQIRLSKTYVQNNPEESVKDTILHEIAHALTPGHQHDATWKAMARKLGAKPNRTSKAEMPYNWILACSRGCWEVGYHRRPTSNTIHGGRCKLCRGLLDARPVDKRANVR